MINAKELRLGNIIEANGPPMEVKAITEHTVELYLHGSEADNWEEDLENCNGIPLSAEILGMAGFGYLDFGTRKKYILEDFEISLYQNGEFTFMWNGQVVYLKSVHQLQNLYFALTGEELPVEL